jgi:hypothetical protein
VHDKWPVSDFSSSPHQSSQPLRLCTFKPQRKKLSNVQPTHEAKNKIHIIFAQEINEEEVQTHNIPTSGHARN